MANDPDAGPAGPARAVTTHFESEHKRLKAKRDFTEP